MPPSVAAPGDPSSLHGRGAPSIPRCRTPSSGERFPENSSQRSRCIASVRRFACLAARDRVAHMSTTRYATAARSTRDTVLRNRRRGGRRISATPAAPPERAVAGRRRSIAPDRTDPKVESMTYSVAVSGASGYAGGEILRLLADHPDFEVRTVTAHANAGQPLVAVQPHLRTLHAPDAEGDHAPRPSPVTTSCSSRCRTAHPGAIAAELAGRHARDRLRRRPPSRAHRRLGRVLRRRLPRPRGPTASPSSRGSRATQRDRLAKTRRIAAPGCNASTVALSLAPGIRAGVIEDRRPRLGARRRPVGRRQEPARRTCSAPRSSGRRTRTPSAACTGTSPRSHRRCAGPGASDAHPVVHARHRADVARHPRDLDRTDHAGHGCRDRSRGVGGRLRRRAVRAAAARGPVPAHRRRARREHRAHGARGRRASRTASSSSPRSTTSSRAPRVPPSSPPTSRSDSPNRPAFP